MKNRKWKNVLLFLLSAMLILASGVQAYALEALQVDKKGSISVAMKDPDSETAVAGGSLTLYQVAEVQVDNGNASFVFADDFSECKLSLENVQSQQLVKDLVAYVKRQKLTGVTKTIDKDGILSFTNLELGLYLVIQNEAADGYYAVEPFLITIPIQETGSWIYDVDAMPKLELEKTPKPSKPSKPSGPSGSTTPGVPAVTILPQTGQLNWPIPLLTVLGLGLFAFGWSLRFAKKENCNAG